MIANLPHGRTREHGSDTGNMNDIEVSIARKVDDLVRSPAASSRFREMLAEYDRLANEYREARDAAEDELEDNHRAIRKKPRLRDKEAGPPEKGWSWREDMYFDDYQDEQGVPYQRSVEIAGWLTTSSFALRQTPGISVTISPERPDCLRYSPKSAMTNELLARLKSHKANILILLQESNVPEATSQCDDLPPNVNDWPEDWRYVYEERAGIMEYDGNLTRQEAEQRAETIARAAYSVRDKG